MALKLYVDFDGTLTREDVGNQFFRTFGGDVCDSIVQEYHEGRISAVECFRRELRAAGRIPLKVLDEFLARQEMTPGVPGFFDYCRSTGIDVTVLSDGLDLYIHRLLERNGLHGARVYANRLTLSDLGDGTAVPALDFPHGCSECGVCACCKRNVLLTTSGEEDIVGYIGEGFSDRCAVEYADIVFAKDDLQRHCQEQNISYYCYSTFDDVVSRLQLILSRKRLRKRRRAEVKRREAFVCEA